MTDEIQKQPQDLELNVDWQEDTSRILPKSRKDVEITEQVFYGKPCFVLKDPTTLKYFRLRPPEYLIYQLLDGENTLDDILRALAERFPADQFEPQTVMNFLVMLRGANLLIVPGKQNTEYLLKRKKVTTRGFWTKLRTEFLFYKIPLLDPDKLLIRLDKTIGRFLFTRGMAILVFILLVGAIYLFIGNIDNLSRRMPLLSWINLMYLVPSFLIVKLIHEFGHGLTARHFGTEVHEMGILFLVFTPCPYCDVSDCWMLSDKGKRMWITAAGIAVEIVLAAMACYIWSLTKPGTVINQFALNVMLMASINTLLFNGNPLLRYDGYYFMMDMIEIPNLKQKSSSYLWYLFQRYVLGEDNASEPMDAHGRENGLVFYAICSTVYRWFIMVAIITMIWKFLDPYGLGALAAVMALASIYSALIQPVFRFFKYLYTHRHAIHLRIASFSLLVVIILGTVVWIMMIKVEQSVDVQCVLRPTDMQVLYVTQPGLIDLSGGELVRDGQEVTEGQVLLTLRDPELESQYNDINYEIEQLKAEREQARSNMNQEVEAVALSSKIESLETKKERIAESLERLKIIANANGRLQLRLPQPLEQMDGMYLALQREVMAIYQYGDYEAIAAVNHRDIERIQPEQKVRIKLWAMDDEELETQVKIKPPTHVLRLSSPALSTAFHGETPTLPSSDPKDALEPAENTYELIFPLQQDARLRDGLGGRAKILFDDKTLFQTFYWWLIQTLRQDIRL